LRYITSGNKITGLKLAMICGICGMLIGLFSVARESNAVGFAAIFVLTLLMLVFIFRSQDTTLNIILFIAFTARVGLAFFDLLVSPISGNNTDTAMFEGTGWQFAQYLNSGIRDYLSSNVSIYGKVIGFIYLFTGRMPLVIQYLNVLLGVITVFFVYMIILELKGGKRRARIGSLIAALFPTLSLFSVIILRESIITFLVTLSIYFFLKWLNTGNNLKAVFAVALMFITGLFHGAMLLIIVVYAFFICFYRPNLKKWGFFQRKAILPIIIVAAVLGLLGTVFLNKLPGDLRLIFSHEYLSDYLKSAISGRAAYLLGFYPGSLIDIFIQTPIRVVYFMFAPFPWMVSSTSDIQGLVDSLIYVVLTCFTIIGLKRLYAQDKNLFFAVLFIILVFIVAFAWGTANFGAAIRHRQKILCIIISVSALGMFKSEKPRIEGDS
jgi:hypothetical protein